MNGNKGARVLNRIFHVLFFISMAVAFIGTLYFRYIRDKDENNKDIYYSVKAHLLIYGAAVLMLVFFCLIYALSKKDLRLARPSSKLSQEAKFRIILFSVLGVILLIQLYFGAELKIYSRTDLRHLDYYAKSFATTGSFDTARDYIATGKNYYMARYPNNFALMMILAVLYRVCYLIFGYIPLYAPVVLNVLAINVSLLFTVLIAKQMWGRKKALYTLAVLALFAPFYAYVSFYYTDSMSMPFGVAGIYLFLLGLKTEKDHRVSKFLLLFFAGAIIFLGFKVKGSIGVMIAVAVVYALLKCKLKEFACVALALAVGFGSFAVMYKVGYNTVGLVTEEQADRYEYPLTHWVMMGLKGKGGWNRADSNFTDSFETKAEKQEANIDEIKNRVKKMINKKEFVKHFVIKGVWLWHDGTYFIPGHITDYVKRSWLHDFVLRDGKYYYVFFGYSNAFQLVMMLMMLMSLIKGFLRPKINFMIVIKGCVFALYMFLLIWEARSRYMFNMTPLYILMMVDGISYTNEFVKKLTDRIKNKSNKKPAHAL